MASKDDERRALIDSLLRRAHEQSLAAPERAPFWREGTWRCEYYRGAGDDKLKVFRGGRCVHEEVVPPGPQAHARSQELRQAVIRERRPGGEDGPPD